MEVATRDHFAGIGEDQWVIRDRVGLCPQHLCHMLHHVAYGPHHLRLAPETVRILHTRVVLTMRLTDRATGQQAKVVLGHDNLARLATHGMDARIEGRVRAAGGIDAHRAAQHGS